MPAQEAPALPIPTVADMIREKFHANAAVFLRVAECESGQQPYNWNGKWQGVSWEDAKAQQRAVGVFQIYLEAHPEHKPEDLLDPVYNIDVAYKLSNGGTNLMPWEASRHCWQ